MTINFQQVREQVKTLGENAAGRASQLQELRQRALELLNNHAGNLEGLRQRVLDVANGANDRQIRSRGAIVFSTKLFKTRERIRTRTRNH